MSRWNEVNQFSAAKKVVAQVTHAILPAKLDNTYNRLNDYGVFGTPPSKQATVNIFNTATAPVRMLAEGDPGFHRLKSGKWDFNPDKNLNRAVQTNTKYDGIHRALGVSDHSFNKSQKVAAAVAGNFGAVACAADCPATGSRFCTVDGVGAFFTLAAAMPAAGFLARTVLIDPLAPSIQAIAPTATAPTSNPAVANSHGWAVRAATALSSANTSRAAFFTMLRSTACLFSA